MITATVTEQKELFVEIASGWQFFREQGEGEPVVVIHAAGSSSWTWRRAMPGLAEAFHVFVPDLPGFDRSATPERDYGIEDFSGDLVELMDRLGIRRAHLIGNLTGGMIALDMANRFPDRVNKLVLVSTPCWTPEEGKIVYERYFVPWYGDNGIPKQRSFEEIRSNYGNADPELAAFHNSVIARNGRWFSKVHEVNSTFNVPSTLPKVTQPTLLVYGDRCSQLRREPRLRDGIAGTRTVIIPNAAAHSYYEQPAAFVAAVVPFLEGAS